SLQQYGMSILLPVGCSGFEDWLLDKVDVGALLPSIARGGELDLMAVCRAPSSQRDGPASRRGSLLGRATPRTPQPSAEVTSAATPAPAPADRGLELSIQDVTLDLDESQLKDLTYATFLAAAGDQASPALLGVLRAQLEVSAARSDELRAVAALDAGAKQEIGTLHMHARLLKTVRPSSFSSFKNFVRWRRGTSATLWCVLRQAATQRWRGASDGSGRAALARLRGALRRADVADADEYDEAEYAAATAAVVEAAGSVAACCDAGWDFGWLLCASIADRLLRGTFDALSEAEYVAESDELVGLLRARVWPALGITPELHLALYAWVHFRQFVLSGEGRLLDSANTIVKALPVLGGAGAGEASGGDGADTASNGATGNAVSSTGNTPTSSRQATPRAPDSAAAASQVLGCLSEAVLGLLRDYHGSLLDALAFVLLDGGPLRLFVPGDVDALEADLTALQALFHAEADGLELDEVESASAPLSAILDAMALDTDVLIANYKQALALPARPLATTQHGAAPAPAPALDPDVLLRVLCHRAEHAASKFLKGLKINKRLPLSAVGQAGEVLQKVKSKTSPGLLRGFSTKKK
ncbi:hypothetical protein APUTEX25_002358, partial [Auxenochlorella protothecoides]